MAIDPNVLKVVYFNDITFDKYIKGNKVLHINKNIHSQGLRFFKPLFLDDYSDVSEFNEEEKLAIENNIKLKKNILASIFNKDDDDMFGFLPSNNYISIIRKIRREYREYSIYDCYEICIYCNNEVISFDNTNLYHIDIYDENFDINDVCGFKNKIIENGNKIRLHRHFGLYFTFILPTCEDEDEEVDDPKGLGGCFMLSMICNVIQKLNRLDILAKEYLMKNYDVKKEDILLINNDFGDFYEITK